MDTTDCAESDDCGQVVRQAKSLVAAMAAAVFSTVAAIVVSPRWKVAYATVASLTALKAVFHQFMVLSNGDPRLPITILTIGVLMGLPILLAMAKGQPKASRDGTDT